MYDNQKPIGIDELRIKHMISVARRASELGKEIFGWDAKKCEELFVMGLLHDVGYEFVCSQTEHEEYGGELLHRLGFKYSEEIYNHGKVVADSSTAELIILNIADMQTSRDGMRITMDERLADIQKRYGADSTQYTTAEQLKTSLESWLAKHSVSSQ